MSADTDRWREGHRVLAERVRALPRLLRDGGARSVSAVPAIAAASRRIVLTGVGSSAAHARFLAHLLRERSLDARALPLSAFLAPRATASEESLIVFSQGLSPNARIALADPAAWAQMILVTAATEENARECGDTEKADVLVALRDAGVTICPLPAGENEYTTLVRVIGPMAGYVAALHLAEAAAGATGDPEGDLDAICTAIAAAPGVADAALSGFDVRSFAAGMAFVTAGTYSGLVDNLRYKVVEGMLLPAPPVWDLLHVAHGPIQHLHAGAATWLALTRRDTAQEQDLLALIERALDPDRHRLLRLEATLTGPLAIFEHEAVMNELMLRYIAAAGIDQVRWPGKGRDAELYGLDAAYVPRAHPPAAAVAPRASRRLDSLTWPELEALMTRGVRTAVIPLGATEQHGPHLPFATDAWVADALAERFCARVPDAIHCPVLALGCSSEHLDFPGTLNLETSTLERVLHDVLLSLRRHGFISAFVFSAHGGNFSTLRDASTRLRSACAPMRLCIHDDLDALAALWHRLSAEYGESTASSGHHAGEFETSIVAALRPQAVRGAMLAPGLLVTGDAQTLFYPSLRPNAPSGVVGDPSAAAPERGRRYLDAWTDLLVAAYRDANHSA